MPIQFVVIHDSHITKKHFFKISSNSEAFTSEFQEILKNCTTCIVIYVANKNTQPYCRVSHVTRKQ